MTEHNTNVKIHAVLTDMMK